MHAAGAQALDRQGLIESRVEGDGDEARHPLQRRAQNGDQFIVGQFDRVALH
jgi:hypothetical protein